MIFDWFTRRAHPEAPQRLVPSLPPPPPPPSKTAEEMLADAMARLREDLRAVEFRAYHEAKAQTADAEARIAAARAFLERTGLVHALREIVSEIWHWGSHMRHPTHTFARDVDLGLLDLASEPRPEGGPHRADVSFLLRPGGERYRIVFEQGEDPWYDLDSTDRHADCSVHVSGAHMLTVSMIRYLDRDEEYHQWSVVTASVLRPGPWIAGLLELEHRIRVHQQDRSMAWDIEYKRQQAAGLPPASELKNLS